MKFLAFLVFSAVTALYAAADWGPHVDGVVSRVITKKKVIYLTFDACGGGRGSGYDAGLIQFLIDHKIEATLFINSRWIDANPETFMELSKNPLFSLQNHGTRHKPLSLTPRRAYGIRSTGNEELTRDEILGNHEKMKSLTGIAPKFFRAGTAYYDVYSVELANDLGYRVIGFDVNGDGGATFNPKKILKQAHKARPGSIFIFHMNKPRKSTFAGLRLAYEYWRSLGYTFRRLDKDL